MIGALPTIATIGVYGWTLDAWLDGAAGRRRPARPRRPAAARGPGQRVRLGERAAAAGRPRRSGIAYEHRKELAPTTELRQLQYAEDDRLGVGKRSRVDLAPEYVERYAREILGQVDLRPIVEELPAAGAAALMCVERDPEACHRSLIADRLAAEFGLSVTHLRPA